MDVSWITCATKGCGYSPFPMESGFEDRARRTHETFYCPAGHSLSFRGESRQEREHRERVENLQWQMNNLRTAVRHYDEESRKCPWPTCREYVYASRDSMYEHMRRTHGMPLLAAVRDAS